MPFFFIAWTLVITLKCHYSNVTSVLFHTRKPLIIVSTSKDRRPRELNIRLRLEHRFWTLAGHDSGLIVFKFDREHHAFDVSENYLFYANDLYLWVYDFTTQTLQQGPSIVHTSAACWDRISWNPNVLQILNDWTIPLFV